MKKIILLITSLSFLSPVYGSETFRCSKFTPEEYRLEKPSACDDTVIWRYDLPELRKKDPNLFEKQVSDNVRETSNMGGAKFRFPSGREKSVYRSSFMAGKKECLSRLVNDNRVLSIFSYYSGSLKESSKTLSDEERRTFADLGGKFYHQPLNYEDDFKKSSKEGVFEKVTEIIKAIDHAPGNVLIHCYGGINRTGVLFGVMQKCLNKIPIEDVLNEYKCHTGWESEERVGGYEIDNEIAIREYPCEKLYSPATQGEAAK